MVLSIEPPLFTLTSIKLPVLVNVFQTVILSDAVDLDLISAQLDGYSGDDITNICRDAAMNGMRRITQGKTPAELKKLREMGQVRVSRHPLGSLTIYAVPK